MIVLFGSYHDLEDTTAIKNYLQFKLTTYTGQDQQKIGASQFGNGEHRNWNTVHDAWDAQEGCPFFQETSLTSLSICPLNKPRPFSHRLQPVVATSAEF